MVQISEEGSPCREFDGVAAQVEALRSVFPREVDLKRIVLEYVPCENFSCRISAQISSFAEPTGIENEGVRSARCREKAASRKKAEFCVGRLKDSREDAIIILCTYSLQ